MKQSRFGLKIVLIGWSALTLSACASWNHVEKSVFRNSAMHNLNPAPETMSPPPQDSQNSTIDPTYMRSQADYHYAMGEALSGVGETEKAIEEFKLTLVYDPDVAHVRVRLAAEYIKQGLLSEAIEQAEKAIDVDPTNIEPHLLLGGLYSTLKMYKQAMHIYSQLQISHPENGNIPLYMGALQAEQANFVEAEKHFLRAAKHPNTKKAHIAYYYLGKIRASQGKSFFKKAEAAFQKSLAKKPSYGDTVLALAGLYEAMGKPKRALKLVESFQEKFGPKREIARYLSQIYLDKDNFDKAYEQLHILEAFEPGHLNIKVKMALILIEKQDYPAAIEKLEEIIRIDPNSDRIRFYLGAVYEEVGQFTRAISHFSEIPATSTYFPEAVIHMAYLYKQQYKLNEAIEVVVKGIELRDDVPQFYSYYASLLDEKKDYATAVSMLGKAVEMFPSHTQLRFFLGSMYDRTGQLDKTIEQMKKVLEVDANHVQAMNYLAYTFAERNENMEEAESLARRALELKPNDGYILDTFGWILFKQGKYKEAIQYLEAAHKAKPMESIVAEHLGDAYYKYQLIEKAKSMYRKAASIEKDQVKNAKILNKLSNLEKQTIRTPASISETVGN